MGIVNKKYIYFDVDVRTDKSIMLKSLADATVNAREKSRTNLAIKSEVAKELVNSLNNIRTIENGLYGSVIGAKDYKGTETQFNSKYIPGLEFGIWKATSPSYKLTSLAELLQKSIISKDTYISIVMFSYIQIIDNNIVSILEECIKLATINKEKKLMVGDIFTCNTLVNSEELQGLSRKDQKKVRARARLLFNVLSETIYFKRISKDIIQIVGDEEQIGCLIDSINKTKIEELTNEVYKELSNQQFYAEYITRVPKELIEYFNKYYPEINLSDVKNINEDINDLILEEELVFLELDKNKPIMIKKPYKYSGKAKKVDFVEKNRRQAKLGKAAEKLVYEAERKRVSEIMPTSVDEVIWISDKYGDGKGYDIESIDIDPLGIIKKKYIEVKATIMDKDNPIDISRNEVECSKIYPDEYVLYRLFNFKSDQRTYKYYTIEGDLTKYSLEPTSYKLYT